MQLTSPSPQFDRVATQRMFNDLVLDMTRHDAKLENFSNGRYTVGAGWSEWFQSTSTRLSDARDAYMQLEPHDGEMRSQLGTHVISLATQGGRLGAWHEDERTFASSWATALDSAIGVAQAAAERLYYDHRGPTPQPSSPVTPPNRGHDGRLVHDAASAARLARQSLATIRQLPTNDTGTAATKDARLAAYNLNLDAQKLIEPHLQSNDEYVVSQLRSADASLEDANWQLAKKPSPDGRFNGVDVAGAQRDTDAAVLTLENLVSSLSTGA